MPTYVYETIPADAAQAPVRYEIQQRMTDPALSVHPQTGERLRRVITLGAGFIVGAPKSSRPTPTATRVSRGCGCGAGCGCG